MSKFHLGLLLLVVAGCATLARDALVERFGTPDPARFDAPRAPAADGVSFRRQVLPLLERRCVVCHGCYDAPCQLKLGSWEGIARGASKDAVYDLRLREAPPSRLFVDAERASAWRERGFHPVLNEYPAAVAELQASLLFRMLQLKAEHPVPADAVLPADIDFSLDRKQSCARIDEFDDYAREQPQQGMPFGLPGLTRTETDTLRTWLLQGAPDDTDERLPAAVERQVAQWEAFLNGPSLKERLMSRYLYEHLFLAHLYFDDQPQPRYFKLVRSATPPGSPIRPLTSRRPVDDPGVAAFHYRLQPERESITVKSHLPYALDAARLARWKSLFLDPDYTVTALPGYGPELAADPFIVYRELPVDARYRFLLDEAEFTVMGFIKGPVCRGQTALNVIDDHFWIFFLAPEALQQSDAEFLRHESRDLRLPAKRDGVGLAPWLSYARQERDYLESKSRYMESRLTSPQQVGLELVWDGGRRNPNAALTVYRHFDSATVLKGMVGGMPKTAWVISYPLLERIHYLLVAGYDVYGSVGHQLDTRLYMDFMRMEGEFNFLVLLPRSSRIALRDAWYRGASDDVKELVYGRYAHLDVDSGIAYRSADPKRELFELLRQRLGPVIDGAPDLGREPDAELRRDLGRLAAVRGTALAWMPEASILRIDQRGRASRYFSLLRNTAHSNLTQMLTEDDTLLPAENTLDVIPGIVGAYPNAIYRIDRRDLGAFTSAVAGLDSEQGYGALMTRFGVRRTSPAFWAVSDALHADVRRRTPIEAGIFDYNRLENR
ncbi:fatty acid cis/trans isomerase CTI [Plasticicumulans lactativorans]|uniref:Fatty acid cis/trans isomerase CTI n=1 Tax=Plasticicumulans lactativorans TaxID=1133106 RepID=A0A4R2L6C7_9GAMM|nr:fatty acid cis/trans isomerase [Plasticicumulans lactativorans]TCO82039.1 fatty acid cis/trans isomerase CTI [Plasticicumulans lactativorans]